jgi:hypothetical protein
MPIDYIAKQAGELNNQIPANEMLDRAVEVPGKKFFNYSALTAGELNLMIELDRLEVYKSFYPELKKDIEQAERVIYNALKNGLHNVSTGFTGSFNEIAQGAIAKVIKAKRLNNPAGAFKNTGAKNPMDNIGNLIDELDCTTVKKEWQAKNAELNRVIGNGGGFDQELYDEVQRLRKKYDECEGQNADIAWLNEHLQDSAHHMLYTFASNSRPGAVRTKRTFHNAAIGIIAKETNLDYTNLKDWLRLGVLRSNAKRMKIQGLRTGLLNESQTIDAIAQYQFNQEREGVNEIATAVVLAIIALVSAAVTAAAKMIDAAEKTKQTRIAASAAGIGTPQWGPEPSDFEGTGPDGSGGDDGSGSDDKKLFGLNQNYVIGGTLLAGGLLLPTIIGDPKKSNKSK